MIFQCSLCLLCCVQILSSFRFCLQSDSPPGDQGGESSTAAGGRVGVYVGVFDGHGGSRCAEFAISRLHQGLSSDTGVSSADISRIHAVSGLAAVKAQGSAARRAGAVQSTGGVVEKVLDAHKDSIQGALVRSFLKLDSDFLRVARASTPVLMDGSTAQVPAASVFPPLPLPLSDCEYV